ncbi:probable LIM domain-containing serine/threonine-protein kinase DDB_G0286997 [Branchiostoma lanceolatum]|uniref:probable LIM domain-containing serine/threonine-protein kinase DDB_G0286997 n=1 Tax=Branchiostoma lanceolatum TaxID=7740 RepID=UPI003452293F
MQPSAKKEQWRGRKTTSGTWRSNNFNQNPSPQQDPDRRWRTQDLPRRPKNQEPKRDKKICPICEQAGRQVFDHFLSACPYLPDEDKERSFARHVGAPPQQESGRGVKASASPNLEAFHKGAMVKILLDSGAESSMIRADEARRLGLCISPNNTDLTPIQADGRRLSAVGECCTTFYKKKVALQFDAIVVEDLVDPIIAGSPFLESNGLMINFSKHYIHLPDGSIFDYSTSTTQAQPRIHSISYSKNRTQHNLARSRRAASCSSVQVQEPKVMHLLHTTPVVNVVTNPAVTEQQTNTRSLIHALEHLSPAAKADTLPVKEKHLSPSADVNRQVKGETQPSPASADANRQVKGETQSSLASADANRQVKGENQPSPASADVNRQVKGETQPSPTSADANGQVKGETQPSPTSTDVNRQVKGETQPSPASADVNRQVKGETQPSPASADVNRHGKGETQPSPASADANRQVKGENQPSLTSADVNRQVKGETQPSPASADVNRQVKGETQPSPASADANRQVKGENKPSPASADANRQVKGETQPSPVPLHQCSPTEGEAETKQTVVVYQHSPTQGITSTPQVKEGQHSNTDADTLRVSEECKTLPPFPNTLQIQEKCQSSPKAAALLDTLQVQLLYQSPRDCPPAPPDHLDRQHPRDHPLPTRAPDLPGYHHPAVRPPPEPPPRLFSQNPGHLRTHSQNFIP